MSLVEALIAMAILTIVMIAFLGLYDASAKLAKSQGNISDATENLRFGVEALIRVARMSGTGSVPLVTVDGTGGITPYAVEVEDNVDGSTSYGNPARAALAGTDVLHVRGVITGELYDVTGGAVNWPDGGTAATISISGESPATGRPQPLAPPPTLTPDGYPVILLFKNPLDYGGAVGVAPRSYSNYRITYVCGDEGVVIDDSTPPGIMTIDADTTCLSGGASRNWGDVDAPLGTFGVAWAAGFLDEMVFFIANNAAGEPALYRHMGSANSPAEELVPNIANLQVAVGCDLDANRELTTAEWFYSGDNPSAPTGSQASFMHQLRLSLVARSQDPEIIGTWQADPDMPENAADLAADARQFRYRTITVAVGLRSVPNLT